MEKYLRILYLLAFIFASSVVVKAQTCNLTLEMYDSWGDGWNGASVDIVVDGVSNNYTFTSGSTSTANITANISDVVTISFNSGAFDEEVTFTLTDANSNVMFSGGPSPSVGLLYTGSACPSCPSPNNIVSANVTSTSMDINWTSTGTDWNVSFVPTGQPMGTTTALTSSTYSATGLTAGTYYDFYVQEDCGGGDVSSFVGPITFSTSFYGDFCANALDLSTISSPYSASTTGFADDVTLSCLSGNAPDAIHYILVPNQYTLVIGQVSNSYDSKHYAAYGGACPGATEVTCLDDPDTDHVSWTNTTGSDQTFYWVQDGFSGASGDYVLEWELTPPPTCLTPTNLSVTNITANSADVSWTSGGASDWNLLLDDGSTTTLFQLTSTSFSLSGLTPGTGYDVYVRDSCGATDVSAWTAAFSFTTPCGAYTPNYAQGFEVFIPNCWTEAEDGNPNSGPTGLGTGAWLYDDFGNVSVNGSAKINLYQNLKNDWLLSPVFDLPASPNTILEFDLALTSWNGTTADNFGSDDSLKILVTSDAGATWTELDNWDNTSTVSPTGDHMTYLLNSYSGQTVQFAFWGTEGTVDDAADIDVFVDNFTLTLDVTCPPPTSVTASNITQTSVDFAWVTGGSANWNIALVPVGSPIGAATSVTSASYSATGLTPDTDYDFYVQDSCGLGDVSTWVGPYSFTTLPTCVAPTSVVAANLTATSIDFSWTGGGAANWDVIVVNDGGAILNPVSVTTESYSVTGLSPETDYDFYVRDSCGIADVSVWVGPYNFTTLPTCPAPTSVSVSNITSNSADFSWISGGASNWNVSIVSTGSSIGTAIALTATDYSASSLSPETTYDFYVQDSCAIGDASQWVGPLTFTTLPTCPAPTGLSINSATETEVSFSWVSGGASLWNYSIVLAGQPIGTAVSANSTTVVQGGLTVGTAYDVYVQDSCGLGDVSDWVGPVSFTTAYPGDNCNTSIDLATLTSPHSATTSGFTNDITVSCLSGTAPDVIYHVEVPADYTLWIGQVSNTYDSKNMVAYGGSCPGATEIDCWDETDTDHVTWENTTGSTQTVYWIQDGYLGGSGSYILEWTLTPPPTCPAPSGLSVSNVTANSAEIAWTTGGASNWNIEIVPSGTTPSGDGVAVSTNPYTATGLEMATDYVVYVQDSCGPADESVWIGPISFTTLCGIFTPPYTQNFDSFVPNCWDEADSGTPATGPQGLGASNWTSDGFANVGGSGAAKINIYQSGDNEWLLSPEFAIPAGAPSYRLQFDLALTAYTSTSSDVFGDDDSLKLLVTSDAGATWSEISAWNSTNTISNTGDHFNFDLTSYAGQTVQFAYWATEGSASSSDIDLFVDNFEIDVIPACPEPTAISASNITDFSADISWTTGGASSWEVQVVETGETPSTSGTTTSTQPFAATGLTTNTTYDVYVRDNCGASGYSEWTGPYSFTTTCVSSVPGDSAEVALPITSIPFTDNGSTATCFTNNHDAGGSAADVWYLLVSDLCAESIDVSVCGSDFDTKLYLYDADMNLINSNDESCGSQSELLAQTITGGDSIYIVVDGYSSNEGNYILNVDQNYPAGLNPGGDTTITICKEDGAIDVLANIGGTPDAGGLWTDADATGELTGTSFDPTAVAPGTYDFVYTVYSGACATGASATLTVNVQKCASGIDELGAAAINCYPNPNNGSFLVETKGNFNLSLYNHLSQLVWEGRTTNDKTSVDISNMPAGIYFLRANGNNQTETIKVIKN